MASGVLHVHDVERTRVTLTMSNHAHTPHVVSSSDHAEIASVELHEVGDLASSDVDDNSVVHLMYIEYH